MIPVLGGVFPRALGRPIGRSHWSVTAQLEELRSRLFEAPLEPDTDVQTVEWDKEGNPHWITTTAAKALPELVKPVEPEPELSWDRAIELANKIHKHKTGSPLTEEWEKGARNALRHFAGTDPISLTVKQIREAVDKMEKAVNSPETIDQRTAAIRGVLRRLIKAGCLPETWHFPFDRLDFNAHLGNSCRTPTPDKYRIIWQHLHTKREDIEVAAKLVIYTGARVNEILSRNYRHLDHDKQALEIHPVAIGNKEIWKPKNKASKRTVPLPAWLFDQAKEVLGRGSWPCELKTVRRITKAAASDLCAHSLRHGWKTASRVAGADPYLSELCMSHSAGSKMD